MKLKIANELSLPLDAATQTFAFIARKGAGKTYAAGKLAEELLHAGVQVVVLDTVGNWYGLRLSADGKHQGFDIPVLGGLRGDIPLEATGGALIADIVVETGRSMVLDASQFSKSDRQRFAAAFGERLWLRKKGEHDPSPIHLVIEESQLIVPQDVRGDTAVMVGVFEEIIRLGRNYGIGVSMITQRPQSVNKEVLNQTECLFVGQVNGAQEREALKKWITHQGMDVHLVDELPGLKIGTFYVWSPQWLNILERVHILSKRTLDASATPKVGGTRIRRELKPLDLSELQERLKATIEKAKADDPRELRKQVAALTRELAISKTVKAPLANEKRIEVPILKDKQAQQLVRAAEAMAAVATRVATMADGLKHASAEIMSAVQIAAKRPALPAVAQRIAPKAVTPQPRRGVSVRHQPSPSSNSHEALAGPEQRILDALAWLESVGNIEPEDTAVAFMAGYRVGGGAYNNPKGRLRGRGLIEFVAGKRIRLTEEGRAAAHLPEIDPSPEALQARVLARLDGPEQRILRPLLEAYPNAVPVDECAAAANYEAGGGAFNNPKGRLRSLGLIEYPQPGFLRAKSVLFLE